MKRVYILVLLVPLLIIVIPYFILMNSGNEIERFLKYRFVICPWDTTKEITDVTNFINLTELGIKGKIYRVSIHKGGIWEGGIWGSKVTKVSKPSTMGGCIYMLSNGEMYLLPQEWNELMKKYKIFTEDIVRLLREYLQFTSCRRISGCNCTILILNDVRDIPGINYIETIPGGREVVERLREIISPIKVVEKDGIFHVELYTWEESRIIKRWVIEVSKNGMINVKDVKPIGIYLPYIANSTLGTGGDTGEA